MPKQPMIADTFAELIDAMLRRYISPMGEPDKQLLRDALHSIRCALSDTENELLINN